VAFEPYVFSELCELGGVKEEVVGIDFRHGSWPGGIVAATRDGGTKKILKLEEWKDEFNVLKLFYTAPRCNMCIDFSAEYADISVGDPWLRGRDGKYLFEDGRTSVLVRTDVGDEIVNMAMRDGYINVKEIPIKTWRVNFEQNAKYKKVFVPSNMRLRRFLGLPTPEYRRSTGGPITISAVISMLCRIGVLQMARFKWFRRLGLFLAQTRPALVYLAWNRKRKKEKFATRYSRMEKFVDRLSANGANKL
jgi:hypothetical protein